MIKKIIHRLIDKKIIDKDSPAVNNITNSVNYCTAVLVDSGLHKESTLKR